MKIKCKVVNFPNQKRNKTYLFSLQAEIIFAYENSILGSLSSDCNEFEIIPFAYVCVESARVKYSDENIKTKGKERRKTLSTFQSNKPKTLDLSNYCNMNN